MVIVLGVGAEVFASKFAGRPGFIERVSKEIVFGYARF
jgi:hypothetical protein